MGIKKQYSGKEIINILLKKGYYIKRSNGSHHFLINDEGQKTVVPVHGNETLGKGLLNKILKDTKLTHTDLI